MKRIFYIFFAVIITLTLTACNNDKKDNNKNETNNNISGNENNKPIDVDLSVDGNEPKYIKCFLIDELYSNPGEEEEYLTQEIFKLNLNHYTFLKEDQLDDNKCELDANGVDSSLASGDGQTIDRTYIYDSTYEDRDWNEHFSLQINYKLDAADLSKKGTLLENVKDSRNYSDVVEIIGGEPHIYGDENDFWYIYYDANEENESLDNILNVYLLLREPKKLTLYNSFSLLNITFRMHYWDEIGKAKLNYMMNDVKQMLKEMYNFDLSEFNINMLGK